VEIHWACGGRQEVPAAQAAEGPKTYGDVYKALAELKSQEEASELFRDLRKRTRGTIYGSVVYLSGHLNDAQRWRVMEWLEASGEL
jgi:hypothetical protein